MKKYLLPLLLILFMPLIVLAACTKKSDDNDPRQLVTPGSVIICNEGNFTYGNASLTVYNPSSGDIVNQAFFAVNNFPVGDVLQSGIVIDNRLFLTVNNSGKILVSDAATLRYLGTIKGLTSPRYVVPVGGNRVYISDLYSSKIAIADISTFQITGYVEIGNSTEQMVLVDGYIYACSWRNNNELYKIDTRTDRLTATITVPDQPNSLAVDRNGDLWVLSEGAYDQTTWGKISAGALSMVDLATFAVQKTLTLTDMSSSPSKLCIDGSGHRLYYINSSWGSPIAGGGVYRMDVTAASLPTEPYIPEMGRTFYGLGVHPRSEDIYVSDAADFQQRGTIFRYNNSGQMIVSFKADIIPGAFYFLL